MDGPKILKSEVQAALKKMKRHKQPGQMRFHRNNNTFGRVWS